MALTTTPPVELGAPAPEFSLTDPEGVRHSLADVRGPKGLVVMFICNHCPYVKAIVDRLVADMDELKAAGVGVVAIMPNDYARYPDDAPQAMRAFANAHGFGFPYLVDEDQDVARAYGAVCTPDFFGFNAAGELAFRGRLDEGRLAPPPPGATRELRDAMLVVADGRPAPDDQPPSMGCSIKWKES